MTIASNIISLSLRNSGVTGVGQVALAQDTADAFSILNAWINEINLERTNKVNPIVCPTFPDQTTDISFWSPFEHVLLTSMAVRLRQIYALPTVDLDVKLAALALDAFNNINLQHVSAPTIAASDGTGYGIIYLALRAAGRVADGQGVAQTSQDVTDAASLLNEMMDEWNQERTVKVIPGTLPTFTNLAAPVALGVGQRNAIVLNLAVRLRDWVGAEVSKTLLDRAERALALIQAINQQQIAPLHGGIPETVIQAIFLALRMAGRINDTQSVSDSSKDVSDAFSFLVQMFAQWQRKRWLIWSMQELALVSTGADFYSIGPGQDFNTPRPDKIHAAWIRLLGQSGGSGGPLPQMLPFPLGKGTSFGTTTHIDLPLTIIEAWEDWATISIKDLKTIPSAVFYDSQFPFGRLYFWPVPPTSAYEMHIVVKGALPVYAAVTDQLGVLPEYVDAVVNNLACRIIVASGGQISPFLLGQAKGSLETIRLANSQIPLLGMPAALSGHRGSDKSSWAGAGLNQAWTVGGSSVLG